MHKIITSTLYLMTLTIPLAFTTINSELFELPKFLILLTTTIIIAVTSAIDYHQSKSKLDLRQFISSPLALATLALLATQALATIFSIDPHTSFWGYYSRFHQGLLTTTCYTLIYFVSLRNLNNSSTHKLIKISILTSILISLYAIAQRFGIDKNLWIQDVVNRPFSTLGQPNWLAAYLLPNLFLTLYLSQKPPNSTSPIIHNSIFIILLSALLITKSRSGLLAFGVSYLAYWTLIIRNFSLPKVKSPLATITIISTVLVATIGTAYSPSIFTLWGKKSATQSVPADSMGTQLQSGGLALRSLGEGGTESGDIRRIVWTGALELIKREPLLGTGPETFAYSYYWTRPVEHNYTSEWDFLYNKAHNEYLNFAATSGLLGLAAYLLWHFQILRLGLTKVSKSKKANQMIDDQLRTLYPTLTASLLGFTITNFFGFSVIPVYLMMVILTTLPSTLTTKPPKSSKRAPLLSSTILPIILTSLFLILLFPLRLLLADLNYSKGKAYLSANNLQQAQDYLERAISYRPNESLYHSYLGEAQAILASSTGSTHEKELALLSIEFTSSHNPYHLNYLKSRTKSYLSLATLDPSYYQQATQELEDSRLLAPTDPKLAYNLGLIYSRLDKPVESIKHMQDAIELKRDYYEPYYALTLLYETTKQTELILPLLQQASEYISPLPEPLQTKLEQYSL